MRILIGVLLLMHGVAHVVGFLRAWGPESTTILNGRVDLGDHWIRLVGTAWIALAIAFAAAAVAIWFGAAWWATYVLALAVSSLALCLLQLPEARLGVVINLVVLALLGWRAGWLGV